MSDLTRQSNGWRWDIELTTYSDFDETGIRREKQDSGLHKTIFETAFFASDVLFPQWTHETDGIVKAGGTTGGIAKSPCPSSTLNKAQAVLPIQTVLRLLSRIPHEFFSTLHDTLSTC